MKNRLIIIVIIVFSCFLLYSQEYDEVKVLKQQATKYVRSKQFKKAESIWTELIKKYPNNSEVVKGAFSFYLSLNKRLEAKEILDKYGKAMPIKELYKARINYNLIAGNFDEAGRITDKMLTDFKSDMNLYRELSRLFSARKQFDKAIEIITKARKMAKDPNLYALEMANAYRESRQLPKAVVEYIKLTKTNPNYFYSSKRYLLQMVKEDIGVIDSMEEELRDETDVKILEIFATALMQVEMYEKALDVYKKLNPTRLLYFANDQFRKGNDRVAILAYSELDNMKIDANVAADAKVKRAKSNLNLFNLEEAERLLLEITQDKELSSNRYKFRGQANREAREILALLALYKGQGKEQVLSHLEDAKSFALNGKNRNKVEQKIIYHQILFGDFEDAKQRLNTLYKAVEQGTDTFKENYFYSYLIALSTKDPLADSLLTELLVLTPQTNNVNDAIYLADISGKLAPNEFEVFMQAWRENELMRPEVAVNTYQSINKDKPNEEVLLAMAKCYLRFGQIEAAKEIYERDFEDEVLGQYALLQLINLSNDDPMLRQQMIVNFLNKNPNSAFAPEYRRVLSEK